MIRQMTIEDYEGVYALWMKIHGFGIRSIDDSKEGVERFLKRNPTKVLSQWRMKRLSEASCVDTMEEGDASIMYVWTKRIGCTESDGVW